MSKTQAPQPDPTGWPEWACKHGTKVKPADGGWGPGVSAHTTGLVLVDGVTCCRIHINGQVGPSRHNIPRSQLHHWAWLDERKSMWEHITED